MPRLTVRVSLHTGRGGQHGRADEGQAAGGEREDGQAGLRRECSHVAAAAAV